MLFRAIPRHSVESTTSDLRAIMNCLLRGRVFEGPEREQFEKEFADYLGVRYAIVMSSAQAGLFFLLQALDLRPGDEIITPAYNYFLFPGIMTLCGLRPVFVDIEPESSNIDVRLIEQSITERTRAISVVHATGYPCRMDRVMEIARRYNLKVIEDCAHATGATFQGRKLGSFGHGACFSFASTKLMSCMGGGAVVTNQDDVAERLRSEVARFVPPSSWYLFKKIAGFLGSAVLTRPRIFFFTWYPFIRFLDSINNDWVDRYFEDPEVMPDGIPVQYRMQMANVQAAVGRSQLRALGGILKRRRRNAAVLNDALQGCESVQGTRPTDGAEPSFLHFYAHLSHEEFLPKLRRALLRRSIDTQLAMLKSCAKPEYFGPFALSYPFAQRQQKKILRLPNNPSLREGDMRYIATAVREVEPFLIQSVRRTVPKEPEKK